MRQRSGPKVDPCGTLGKTGLHDEDCPFKTNDPLESTKEIIFKKFAKFSVNAHRLELIKQVFF